MYRHITCSVTARDAPLGLRSTSWKLPLYSRQCENVRSRSACVFVCVCVCVYVCVRECERKRIVVCAWFMYTLVHIWAPWTSLSRTHSSCVAMTWSTSLRSSSPRGFPIIILRMPMFKCTSRAVSYKAASAKNCSHTHVYIYKCTYMYTYTYTYTCIYTYTFTYTCRCTCTYVHKYYVQLHIDTCTHTYMYAFIHTCKHQ